MMTRMISRRVPVSINDFFKDRSIADIREELDKLEAMANYLIGETTRFQIDVTPSETKVFLEIYRTKKLNHCKLKNNSGLLPSRRVRKLLGGLS